MRYVTEKIFFVQRAVQTNEIQSLNSFSDAI